jgi:hypothetical protein
MGVLRRLGREGLNKNLLTQLADAGPAALPQAVALLDATPKQLAQINRQYRALGIYGGTAGKRVADEMYGAGVKSAEGLVRGLLSQQSALNKAIKRLAQGMVLTLRHELNMHSPSQRLFNEGALAFEGYRLGIESKYGGIERAAAGAGAKSIPGHHGAAGVHIEELHLHYPTPDTVARGVAAGARIASTALGK